MSLFKKLSIFVGASAFLFASLIPLVIAQDQTDGGSGLQVSPTRTEISASAGESREVTLSLKNITQNDVVAKAFINDFQSDNITGNPQIITDTSERTANSISGMVKGLGDVELKPDETKQIKLNVEIPSDAAPGAYFGALRYAAVPKGQDLSNPQDQRQVSLTASVAHLVFVEVSGQINEQIQIEKLAIGKDSNGDNKEIKNSWIFLNSPNRSSLSIKNLGNGFSRPFGSVSINNMFSKEVYRYEVNATDPRGIVLPNSSRTFINNIENVKTPGRYTAIASVAYGNGGEVITYKSTFWYLPAWFLITIVAVIVLIGAGIYLLYRKKYSSKSSKKK